MGAALVQERHRRAAAAAVVERPRTRVAERGDHREHRGHPDAAGDEHELKLSCARWALSARLHTARFTAAPATTRASEPAVATSAMTVELQRSGMTVEVPPERSILDVVRDVLPGVPTRARRGTAAAARHGLLAGRPEHRDDVLSDEERAANWTMMICVSRAATDRLVLDL